MKHSRSEEIARAKELAEARSSAEVEVAQREALEAYKRGWALTGLNGKYPIANHWTKADRPTQRQVENWVKRGNVGVRTGAISGVIVIDDDTEDLRAANALDLPKTVTAITGSGKRHYYYKLASTPLRNSAGRLLPNVDVRGDGGQVVLPGSIHTMAEHPYTWAEGLDPETCELAPFPEHLLEKLQKPKPRPKVNARDRAAQLAIERLEQRVLEVEHAPEGTRNDTLNCVAFETRSFVHHGLITHNKAVNALASAASRAGLDPSEAMPTIQSGLSSRLDEVPEFAEVLASLGLEFAAKEYGPPPPPDADGRVNIMIVDAEFPALVQQAAGALMSDPSVQLFSRGGQLVRVTESPPVTVRAAAEHGRRPLMTKVVDVDWLRAQLMSSAAFHRWSDSAGAWLAVSCPLHIPRAIMAGAADVQFPTLVAITSTPTIRPDGSLLSKPGFDEGTGLYFDPRGVEFPALPDTLDRERAREALSVLWQPFEEFPFESGVDASVALAGVLTALVRPALRTSPMFVITAPKMASGKTLLADTAAMIATGEHAAVMSQGPDEAEDKKRITAILISGRQVVVIDNVERPLCGATLNAVITSESYTDRLLGKSEMVTLPTCATFFATGNNVEVAGDLSTRVLPCQLDPGVERPEERPFKRDLHRFLPEHRPELVSAALTILRAYIEAGRPDQGLPRFGRFEDWSDMVRAPLVWLGLHDPCAARESVEANDPDREIIRNVLLAWRACFEDSDMTAKQALEFVTKNDREPRAVRLAEALAEIPHRAASSPSAHDVGSFLKKMKSRIESGLRIVAAGRSKGSTRWRAERTTPRAVAHGNGIPNDQDHPLHPLHVPPGLPDRRDSDTSGSGGGHGGGDPGRCDRDSRDRQEERA